MVNDILAGILLGMCITLIGTFILVFIAKRKVWVEIRVAPSPSVDRSHTVDHEALLNLYDHHQALEARLEDVSRKLDALDEALAPYLGAESRKNKQD